MAIANRIACNVPRESAGIQLEVHMGKPLNLPLDWPTSSVQLASLDLDPDNSRLMLRTKLADKQLVARLVEQEEALDLARKIAQEGGLHQHEAIVVVRKGNRYLVLEGNRRTAACRILLDPSLLPESQRGRVPAISEELKNRLKYVKVAIAPSVAAAAPLVAALHTERGKKPWSAAAKAFHLGRMSDEGMAVNEIASSQRLRPGAVRKALLSHRLLQVASSTPGLTKEQREHLADPRLKLNPFTRFFGLKRAKRLLNLGVDNNGTLTHEGLSEADTKSVIRAVAQDMLLLREGGGEPRFNTRVHEDTIIGHQLSTKPQVAAILKKLEEGQRKAQIKEKTPEDRKKIPKAKVAPRAPRAEYFQGLDAGGIRNNNALANIVAEAAQFPVARYPAAGIYLQRGLVEACLLHALREQKVMNDFMKAYGPKYGLSHLIDFCKNRRGDLWIEPDRLTGFLGNWSNRFKFIADQTVHVIMDGNADLARQAAAIIRPLVEGILRGDALKP